MNPNNKRIAKNTIYLYIRTVFMMLVALVTSRVVLGTLGFVDYGLYNVVAGVISLFSVLSATLGAATSRYLTFELGLNDNNRLRNVFRTAFNIHLGLVFIVILLGESIGLWLVNHVLNIPPERLFACRVIYQFVIISAVFTIMQIPFNALIIAHEKMNVFACIGLSDAALKLGIAYLISATNFDKLIFYGGLMAGAVVVIYCICHFYCKTRLEGYNLGKKMEKTVFKEMMAYSGWNLFGVVQNIASNQGINILINVFFGPVVNTANAIAQQVNTAVSSFYDNFTTSLNPQIVKTYAKNEWAEMKTLIFRGGRFSFFLLMLFLLPVYLETDILLKLWLKNVPESTILFTRLAIAVSLVGCFGSIMYMAVAATSKIKWYQITVGGTLLLTFPITYLCYKLGATPAIAYIIMIIMTTITVCIRLIFLKKLLGITPKEYLTKVIGISLIVFILSAILPLCVHYFMDYSILRLIVVTFASVVSSSIFVYLLGITKEEKQSVNNFVKNKLHKNG
ncbi:MAG: hypothetical protein LBC89_05050 [Bacteroidales bacterium]|jgi:O-antigen/teichoic acid export membrane protein|nr:hypothetical protein [Bacteroidales bacterium]